MRFDQVLPPHQLKISLKMPMRPSASPHFGDVVRYGTGRRVLSMLPPDAAEWPQDKESDSPLGIVGFGNRVLTSILAGRQAAAPLRKPATSGLPGGPSTGSAPSWLDYYI